MSRALKSSQRGEQRDHEAKKVNAASPRTITCRTVTGGAGMKVGDGLGWPGHHLAHPAHPRYAPAQGQQQQEKGKPVFSTSPPCPAVPGRFRSSTPALPENDAGSGADRLGTVPLSSFALAPRCWAPASVATAALAKSFDLPRAPMSRRGRAHVLSLGGLYRVRETRYGARQTLHQVGRWTAPPSCGPSSSAATCLHAPRVHPKMHLI